MQLTVSPFTARDGENLALYQWHREGSQDDFNPLTTYSQFKPRGVVLIVHGLGEYAERYENVARKLIGWGFVVRSYDQRGHGRSGGQRGAISNSSQLVDDLAEMVDEARLHSLPFPTTAGELEALDSTAPKLPLILLGHSMGGLIASNFVALNIRPVEALVLSSPALDAGLSIVQKLLLALALKLAPNASVGNGLNVRFLSRDPQVVKDYQANRLVHNKISPLLAQFIASAGPATIAAASRWIVPTLLMYAGADKLVSPQGSRRFAVKANASVNVKRGTVTTQCFDDYFHEIFNEPDPAPVFYVLKTWLDERF